MSKIPKKIGRNLKNYVKNGIFGICTKTCSEHVLLKFL